MPRSVKDCLVPNQFEPILNHYNRFILREDQSEKRCFDLFIHSKKACNEFLKGVLVSV